MNLTAHILKIPKTKVSSSYRYSYLCVVPVSIAKQLNLSDKEGLLLKTSDSKIFPTLLNIKLRKPRKSSYIYYFTLPKTLVTDGIKDIKFEIIGREKVENSPEKPAVQNSQFLDLKKILPRKTRKSHPIYKFELNNGLLIWIYNRSHTRYFIFPRFIPLERNSASFLELMGFLLSEGAKYRKDGGYSLDNLSFSNVEFEEIKWALDSFEKLFDIPKNIWKAKILYKNPKGKEAYLKAYWSKTGIPVDNLVVYHHKKSSAEFGAAEPYINSIVLGEVIFELIDSARELSLKTKENAINFLRGLSRGDMECSFVKRIQVGFSQKDKNDLLLFCALCKKLGIVTGKPYCDVKKMVWDVKISGFENFKRIAELGLIPHSKRKYRLLEGLLNSLHSTKYKYLNTIHKGENTSKKLAKILNISEIGTRWYLSNLTRMGLLTRTRWYNKFNPRIYKLTAKGKEELKFYNAIKKELEVLKGVINDN